MSLAFRILYAVYGKGTHHKLALDALSQLACADAEAWQTLFLAHAERFAEGSKAPDDTFKDFTNHVLHPRDGYWGGAPAAAKEWYGKVVAALGTENWDEAAYAAGVLSHYVVDPLMPFHTAQSEAENNIHRAAEWSINRAYDDLRAEGLKRDPQPVVEIAEGPDWLRDLMRANAKLANADYERLIAHYDIKRGVVDPPAGLDTVGRRVASTLLVYASAVFARVLDRALQEASVAPPEVSLLLPALVGAIKIPKAMVLKKLADQEDRRVVEAMYDELMATGKVEVNLPADDRMVRERHAEQVLARTLEPVPAMTGTLRQRVAAVAAVASAPVPTSAKASTLKAAVEPDPAATPQAPALAELAVKEKVPPTQDVAHAKLAETDNVEAAPSIGPKTAERLTAVGVKTVGDLLRCDPAKTADAVAHRGMDAEAIRLWQQQARLVMDIPGLNGTQARLLTGAGYKSAREVAEADPGALCGAVLKFAASGTGQQILRDLEAPDFDRIAGWIDTAKQAA